MNYIILALSYIKNNIHKFSILGIGISFLMFILILVQAYVSGITDLLLNDAILNITGHINVTGYTQHEDGKLLSLIYDGNLIKNKLLKLKEINSVTEYITISSYFIDEKGDYGQLVIKGVEEDLFFKLTKGNITNYRDIVNNALYVPKNLLMKSKLIIGDKIRIKFKNIYGQYDTYYFIIRGVTKNDTLFSDNYAIADKDLIKKLYGISNQYCNQLNIIIHNPHDVLKVQTKVYNHLLNDSNLVKLIEEKNNRKLTFLQISGTESDLTSALKKVFTSVNKENFYVLISSFYQTSKSFLLKIENSINLFFFVFFVLLIIFLFTALKNNFYLYFVGRSSEFATMRSIGMKKRDLYSLLTIEFFIIMILFTFIGSIFVILLIKAMSFLQFSDNSLFTKIFFSNRPHLSVNYINILQLQLILLIISYILINSTIYKFVNMDIISLYSQKKLR